MIKKHIPNFITICNMSCGIIAVLIAITGLLPLRYAAMLVFLGAAFDFFDGFAARMLNAYSAMGKELDSLADLITFGFAPAAILCAIMQHTIFGGIVSDISEVTNTRILDLIYLLIPFIIVIFSAIRLAKFNTDSRQTEHFLGLPTPASALFFCGLVFLNISTIAPLFLALIIILFSALLVSEIPMFSLKIKSMSYKENKIQFIFIAIAILLLAAFQLLAFSFIIITYIILSIALWLTKKKKITI